jgi:ubiquinone/menaquinone biosynthesis C-methylase UbiE
VPRSVVEVQQAYTAWSSTYDQDRNLTRDLDEVVTRQALAGLHFKSILEIGCGTGKNTTLLAQIGEQVLSLDFSEAMIAKARAKTLVENVTFKIADINQPWPCEDNSANLIACNLVLEHIADLSFIFAEAARVLAEGGQLFISELHPFRQYQGMQAHFVRDDETTQIPAFVHHTSEFLDAAAANKFALSRMNEWWHDQDKGKPPRLISFIFRKP